VPGSGKRDVYVPGFGVRVMASGLRVFVLSYVVDGRDGRLKLGRFGPSPDLSVDAARDKARVEYLKIRGGADRAKEERQKKAASTVGELCDSFLKDRADKRPATVRMYTQIITREIKPALGRHKAALVERSHVKELHRKISARAPYQANRVLATMKAIFNLAMENDIVEKNPCRGIEFKPEAKRKRYLEPEQLKPLHDALDGYKDQRVADLFRLLLFTGARVGEWVRTPDRDTPARWTDIDIKRGVWTKPLSTKEKREGHITLNENALVLLRKYHSERASDDAFVFPGLTYDAIKDDWARVLKEAGIKNIKRHDLRHTFGSYTLKATKNIMVVKELLGHANVNTTQRYMHVLDEDLRAGAAAAGEALARPNITKV
jgi:integrase